MSAFYLSGRAYRGYIEYEMTYGDGHLVLFSYFRNNRTIDQLVKKEEDKIKRYALLYAALIEDTYIPYVEYSHLSDMKAYIDYIESEIREFTYDPTTNTHLHRDITNLKLLIDDIISKNPNLT